MSDVNLNGGKLDRDRGARWWLIRCITLSNQDTFTHIMVLSKVRISGSSFLTQNNLDRFRDWHVWRFDSNSTKNLFYSSITTDKKFTWNSHHRLLFVQLQFWVKICKEMMLIKTLYFAVRYSIYFSFTNDYFQSSRFIIVFIFPPTKIATITQIVWNQAVFHQKYSG